ncbi:MAG: fibronectin [Firmicutes bacterium]|nr:fibronectin [Bacillota bacterium]
MRAKKWLQKVVAAGLLYLVLVSGTALASPEIAPIPAPAAELSEINRGNSNPQFLAGSFFQPSLVTNWTESDFAAEYAVMKAVSMDHIIWQWTVDTKAKQACYPTVLPGYSSIFREDLVEASLAQAEKQGMKVWLGLAANDDWLRYYANDEKWLANEVGLNKQVAQELWQRYGGSYGDTIAGFYIWLEVDNVHFQNKERQNRLAGAYREIVEDVHHATGKPVMIAPYFAQGRGQDAAAYAAMWGNILKTAPIDIIALQDGFGGGQVSAADIGIWLAALQLKIAEVRPQTELWSDLETFTPEYLPASISRVISQIKAEQKFVSKFTSFSFNHYNSPNNKHRLPYFQYKNYVDSFRQF